MVTSVVIYQKKLLIINRLKGALVLGAGISIAESLPNEVRQKSHPLRVCNFCFQPILLEQAPKSSLKTKNQAYQPGLLSLVPQTFPFSNELYVNLSELYNLKDLLESEGIKLKPYTIYY